MTLFARFELSRGEWVSHETTLHPPHRKSDWDVRCEACQRAKGYVQAMTARMRNVTKSWTMAT